MLININPKNLKMTSIVSNEHKNIYDKIINLPYNERISLTNKLKMDKIMNKIIVIPSDNSDRLPSPNYYAVWSDEKKVKTHDEQFISNKINSKCTLLLINLVIDACCLDELIFLLQQ